jgi:asparagine synthase (glutamine-hydrolysing)
LVNEYFILSGEKIELETYSIGLEGSEDLKYARIVADYLGTKHTEIVLTEQEFIDAIPEVIYAIESYDTTTVRASIGNYKLGEYISQNSLAKVIFNGDGSDELCGGYLYMENCPSPIEFDKESRRLLDEIYLFDVLRSDKCISSHGLEPRTPFLDKAWVQYYLSIPPNIRMPKGENKQPTKHLLRSAFSISNISNISNISKQILPDEILWRRKEAFSDGVSKMEKSLYQIIQESKIICSIELNENIPLEKENKNIPLEKEKKYYKNIFMSLYPNSNIIDHYWMPRYIDKSITDASARSLKNY